METLLKSSDDVVEATFTVQSFSQTPESDDSYGGKRRRRSDDEEDQKICATATYTADLILAEEKSANDMDTTLTAFLEHVDLGQFADMTFTEVTCCDLVSVTTRSDESISEPVSTKAPTQAAWAKPQPRLQLKNQLKLQLKPQLRPQPRLQHTHQPKHRPKHQLRHQLQLQPRIKYPGSRAPKLIRKLLDYQTHSQTAFSKKVLI